MHLRPWLCLNLLFSVPTTAFYPYSIVDTLPDTVQRYTLNGSPDIPDGKSQDGKNYSAGEARGAAPTLKMTRRAFSVSCLNSANMYLDLT